MNQAHKLLIFTLAIILIAILAFLGWRSYMSIVGKEDHTVPQRDQVETTFDSDTEEVLSESEMQALQEYYQTRDSLRIRIEHLDELLSYEEIPIDIRLTIEAEIEELMRQFDELDSN